MMISYTVADYIREFRQHWLYDFDVRSSPHSAALVVTAFMMADRGFAGHALIDINPMRARNADAAVAAIEGAINQSIDRLWQGFDFKEHLTPLAPPLGSL